MKYIMTIGIVQCEHCGYISYYGYQDQDKICDKCNAGFFRFRPRENRTLDLGDNYNFEEYVLDKEIKENESCNN